MFGGSARQQTDNDAAVKALQAARLRTLAAPSMAWGNNPLDVKKAEDENAALADQRKALASTDAAYWGAQGDAARGQNAAAIQAQVEPAIQALRNQGAVDVAGTQGQTARDVTGMEQGGATERAVITDTGATKRTGMEQDATTFRTRLADRGATKRTNIEQGGATTRAAMEQAGAKERTGMTTKSNEVIAANNDWTKQRGDLLGGASALAKLLEPVIGKPEVLNAVQQWMARIASQSGTGYGGEERRQPPSANPPAVGTRRPLADGGVAELQPDGRWIRVQ